MEKLKTLIIDDEELARELLKHYLITDDRIELVGECSNGFEGVLAIQEKKPDLIFLDIQMPKITGFEMLELIQDPPAIIFSTAYDQYAIRAFETNAVDYLLKPYPVERVKMAVDRVAASRFSDKPPTKEVARVLESHDQESGLLNRVVVKNGRKIHVLDPATIHYFESQDDFVMIYSNDGRFLKQKTMRYFEEHLDSNQFVRIHRSYLLNISSIAEIQQYERESWIVVTKSGAKLKVSKSGYANLKERLNM